MIDSHYYYIIVNAACFVIPFLFSFHPSLNFWRNFKPFTVACAIMMMLFVSWDIFFTRAGVWGFNPKYTIGFKIAGLPIEEYLFFFCIPYACLFTYHCLKIWFIKRSIPAWPIVASWLLFSACIIMVFLFPARKYTLTAHLLCAVLLLWHLIRRSTYLPVFIITFLVILTPFFLSNGVLTGLNFWSYPLINTQPELIGEKIVWYNNEENSGIRLFSIPVEDVSYGMAMLLLVTTIYEYILPKSGIKNSQTSRR